MSVDLAAPGVNVLSTKAAWCSPTAARFPTRSGPSGERQRLEPTTDLPLGVEHGGAADRLAQRRLPDGHDNWARTSAINLTGYRDLLQFHAYVQTELVR